MTESKSPISEADLAKLFEQERAAQPSLSDDFSARLLRDAEDVQVEILSAPVTPKARSKWALPGWLNWVAWPAGMATATLAGVWIGFASGPEIALGTSGLWSSDVAMDLAVSVPAFSSYIEGY